MRESWETIIGDTIGLLEPITRDVVTTLENSGEREVTGTLGLEAMAEPFESVGLESLLNNFESVGLENITVNGESDETESEESTSEESTREESSSEESASEESASEESEIEEVGDDGMLDERNNAQNGTQVDTGDSTGGGTIGLEELFNRSRDITALDSGGRVTLEDLTEGDLSTTYQQPSLPYEVVTNTSEKVVEFGDKVTEVRMGTYSDNILEFSHQDYREFHEELGEAYSEEMRIERQNNERESKFNNIRRIARELFGDSVEDLYGMDKIGRNSRGEPYAKAFLSTRFEGLYDREFRESGIRRSVAVAKTTPSVRESIEATFTLNRGELKVVIEDSEGERIPYLEDKFNWLKGQRVDNELIVLYLKTQYEFEENITTMNQLKNLDFTTQ